MTIESFCKELDYALTTATSNHEKVRCTETLLNRLGEASLPCCGQWDCCDGRYARHLVFHGKESGCCIVAMAWAPGQGTPVHDHDGTWCVEVCLEGQLEVTRYELQDTMEADEEGLYRFLPVETECVGRGNVGCLIPPYEHHVLRNPFVDRAVTLHVYGRELLKASCFEPLGEDRYRRVEKPLSYASA